MTIRKSLILSHIVVCILPFLMTFFVLASAFAGLLLYAASGNHVIAESGFQFNVMTQILRTTVFHSLRHNDSLSRYAWVMEITDPVATYVVVEKEGIPLYSYGNEAKGRKEVQILRDEGVMDRLDGRDGDGIYSVTDEPWYRFVEKGTIRNETYHLYIMAHHPRERNDGAIEKAVRGGGSFYPDCSLFIYPDDQLFPVPFYYQTHHGSLEGAGTGSGGGAAGKSFGASGL